MKNKKSTLDELILSSISNVLEKKGRCAFGDLVEESFNMYPEIFSLADHPNWPDTLKLDRPLRNLRDQRLITGSPTTFYLVTSSGRQELLSTKSSLSKKESRQQRKIIRSPLLLNLKEIEKSKDYKEFLNNPTKYTPSNMRIRFLTKFTLETPNKTVFFYLKDLRASAYEHKKNNLINFIDKHMELIDKNIF